MSLQLVFSLLCFVFAIVFLILSLKVKGKFFLVAVAGSLVLSFILPFFLSAYFQEIFVEADLGYAKAVGFTGGFLLFVIVLAVLLRDWHPNIGRCLITIFLTLGVITIILGVYLSKSFFVDIPVAELALFM